MNRRQFLKCLGGLLPSLALGWMPPSRFASQTSPTGTPNVLILLFDAFSARNVSLLGYPRQTTPNLTAFASAATVYHRHYAAGNFTNPGTASLLTGTYPWTHRALHLFDTVARPLVGNNVFRTFSAGYHRISYSHNLQVTGLLYDFRPDLEEFKWTRELCLADNQMADLWFPEDYNMALWRERLFRGSGYIRSAPTSLLIHRLSNSLWSRRLRRLESTYRELFPQGLPNLNDQVFLLEDAINWLIQHMPQLPKPFLAYFHLLPPHDPYKPRREFIGRFDDGWQPVAKPRHSFAGPASQEELNRLRCEYDEFIAYADAEFGRLCRAMVQGGWLDSTCLVLTSDHGEMFERGIWQHTTETLYEPVVHIPLLVSWPGQQQRQDVYAPTSCVDVLPTLLHATGQPIPDWCEGQVLPPFAPEEELEGRSIYVVEAKRNAQQGPLTKATVAMIRGRHKLIHYLGYPGYEDRWELYDLGEDPEELHDLYSPENPEAHELQAELSAKLEEVNHPYRRS